MAPGLAWHLAGWPRLFVETVLSLEQLRAFLARVQDDDGLRAQVLAAATADDVAQIAAGLGFEFSGDALLRASGQRFGRVTVTKQDLPGEYN
jgi:predicted ribosomally synthesized peptide with nif11-like leader